jgi:hypothetical protein
MVPYLSLLISGEVASYHAILVNGKRPKYRWRHLDDFTLRFAKFDDYEAAVNGYPGINSGIGLFDGYDRVIIGEGATELVCHKHLRGAFDGFVFLELG